VDPNRINALFLQFLTTQGQPVFLLSQTSAMFTRIHQCYEKSLGQLGHSGQRDTWDMGQPPGTTRIAHKYRLYGVCQRLTGECETGSHCLRLLSYYSREKRAMTRVDVDKFNR